MATTLCTASPIAPEPPHWLNYDTGDSSIVVEWVPVGSAIHYYIYGEYDASILNGDPIRIDHPTTTTKIQCGQTDGRDIRVSLEYSNQDGERSLRSVAVSMLCAAAPQSPDTPFVVLANQDIVEIGWEHPLTVNNGGSSVMGFKLQMKDVSDTEYTLVQDGAEDPTTLRFTTRNDHNGDPLAASTYLFKLSASNKVGLSEWSEALQVEVPPRVSHTSS
jgi:hemolysin activation/secretion protein